MNAGEQKRETYLRWLHADNYEHMTAEGRIPQHHLGEEGPGIGQTKGEEEQSQIGSHKDWNAEVLKRILYGSKMAAITKTRCQRKHWRAKSPANRTA